MEVRSIRAIKLANQPRFPYRNGSPCRVGSVPVGAIPPWLPRQSLGVGRETQPLRKIVVSAVTVPMP